MPCRTKLFVHRVLDHLRCVDAVTLSGIPGCRGWLTTDLGALLSFVRKLLHGRNANINSLFFHFSRHITVLHKMVLGYLEKFLHTLLVQLWRVPYLGCHDTNAVCKNELNLRISLPRFFKWRLWCLIKSSEYSTLAVAVECHSYASFLDAVLPS